MPEEARGRALVVRRLQMLPVECVVRGYITGSGWKDYQATGTVSGIELPAGLRESERLPEPIFTPSTKADVGHDEAIDFDRAAELVGDRALMARVADVSIELYSFAAEHARERGVILADTKFEFGLDDDRPSWSSATRCSRPTPRATGPPTASRSAAGSRASTSSTCATGRPRAAGTSKPPAPAIPDDVVAGTRARYVEAYERITGEPFSGVAATRDWRLGAGTRAMRARVLIRPKAGILDPQGVAVERALPGARLRGRRRTSTSGGSSSSTSRTPRSWSRCARSCSPTRSSRTTRFSCSTRGSEVRRPSVPRLLRRGRRAAGRAAASATPS